MEVRVIRARNGWWYADKIGEVFLVWNEIEDSFGVRAGSTAFVRPSYILKSDCEVVGSDEEEAKILYDNMLAMTKTEIADSFIKTIFDICFHPAQSLHNERSINE